TISVLCASLLMSAAEDQQQLKLATFEASATPPIGSPLAYAPARRVIDPLSVRGVILSGAGEPIVIGAVDWIGIANGGHDVWRERLAEAAGTTPDRVTVHTLHQHDAPRCDFTAEELLAAHGLGDQMFSPKYCEELLAELGKIVPQAIRESQAVTH